MTGVHVWFYVYVCVYLSVQWLIDVHSVVLGLLDEHVSTLPDESCGRVGVDGAAQEHCLLLVVAATHVTDGLVNRQHWCVKVYKTQTKVREGGGGVKPVFMQKLGSNIKVQKIVKKKKKKKWLIDCTWHPFRMASHSPIHSHTNVNV